MNLLLPVLASGPTEGSQKGLALEKRLVVFVIIRLRLWDALVCCVILRLHNGARFPKAKWMHFANLKGPELIRPGIV
jgi:hypothetical protein